MPKIRPVLITFVSACLAVTSASSQTSDQVNEALKDNKRPKPERSAPKPPRTSEAEQYTERAAKAFDKLHDCRGVENFASRFRLPAYAQRVAAARARYCPRPIEVVNQPSNTEQGSVPSSRPRTAIDGNAVSTGRNPIEFLIGGKTVRLAGVIGCNSGNDRTQFAALLSRVLVCRPLGADYQCFTKGTNKDVGRLAVKNGNAQPTGEDYENEYYEWKRAAEEQRNDDVDRKEQHLFARTTPDKLLCLAGR